MSTMDRIVMNIIMVVLVIILVMSAGNTLALQSINRKLATSDAVMADCVGTVAYFAVHMKLFAENTDKLSDDTTALIAEWMQLRAAIREEWLGIINSRVGKRD